MSTTPNIGRLWKRITVVLVLWRMLPLFRTSEDSFFHVFAFSIHHIRHPARAPVSATSTTTSSRRKTAGPSSLFMGGYYSEPQDTDDESSQDTAHTHMIFGVRCRETAIPMDNDYQHYITVLDPIRDNDDNDDDLFAQRQALVHYNEYQLALWFWNHHEHLMGGNNNDEYYYAHQHHHWVVWESPYSRGLVSLTVAAILQAYEKTDEFVTVMSTSNSQQLPRIIQSAYLFYNGGDPNYMRIQQEQEGRYLRHYNNQWMVCLCCSIHVDALFGEILVSVVASAAVVGSIRGGQQGKQEGLLLSHQEEGYSEPLLLKRPLPRAD